MLGGVDIVKNSKENRLVPSLSSVIAVAVILVVVVIFFMTVIGASDGAAGAEGENAAPRCETLCPVEK